MCPVVLRLIMNMYINQSIQVKWNSIVSAKCYISNGVKQGGCISPTFFSVYLNRLIETLRKNNIGCRYGSEFMGVYCYADESIKYYLMLKRANCCILLSLANLKIPSYL